MNGFEKWAEKNFIVPISKHDVLYECWQESAKQERKRILAEIREGCNESLYSKAANYWGKWWADRIIEKGGW